MSTDARIRTLIAQAGLTHQGRCVICGKLLLAFGRDPKERWSCPQCKAPDATVAQLDDEAKS